MATWRDGPRYAPQERPAAFAEPSSGISLAPQPDPPALPSAPAVLPDSFEQPPQPVPLDSIVAVMETPRDPLAPYATSGALLTAQGPMVDERDPKAPYEVTPSIDVMPVYQPFAMQEAPVGPPPDVYPVPIKDLFIAAYPPLLITLVLGGLVSLMSIFALLIAAWVLAGRVSFRGNQLRIAAWSGVGLYVVLGIVFHFVNQGMYNLNLQVSVVGQIMCLVLILVDIVLQWISIRRGERPTPHA